MKNVESIKNKKMWTVFWITIIILLIIYFSAIYKANEISKVQATEDGEHVELSAEIAEVWEKSVPNILGAIDDELNSKAKSEINALIDDKIEAAFNKTYAQIPKFADFHYSVTGEYTEIVEVLSGEMSNRVQEILFKQVGFDANLKKAFTEISDISQEKISVSTNTINYDIQIKINISKDDINKFAKILHLTTQDVKNRFRHLAYNTISDVNSLREEKVGEIVLAKIMGKKLAIKIAAKTSVKTSAKVGGVLSGAGTSAGVCAVGGPIAAGLCGIVGGVVTWVVVDKLIVETDEYFNRDEFEQELRGMIDDQKQEIKKGLHASYSTVIATLASEQKNKIKSGIVIPKHLISN